MKSHETYALLFELWRHLHDVNVLWELAVAGLCLGLAWGLYRAVAPRFSKPEGKWAAGLAGLQRVAFPVTALALVMIGRGILGQWQPTPLLHVVVPLLVAFAIIGTAAYMLGVTMAADAARQAALRVFAWIVWIGFAVHVTGMTPLLLGFLDDIGWGSGEQRVSLLLILEATLAVLAAVLIALWLGRLIEGRLMRADGIDINVRAVFAKMVQALLVLAAMLIALPAVGVDLTAISVFGGALGVGLGFGLQKIASNYVSGFIILLDRSVSLGDVVTIDKYAGEVVRMTTRYVVVRGADGTETLLPNETLVTTPVVNHTFSDRRVRVRIPLQIGYRSDLQLAMRLMKEAAGQHPRVLKEPAPVVLITQFAEKGIELELGVWIADPQGQGSLRSDLYASIWTAFGARSIDIWASPA